MSDVAVDGKDKKKANERFSLAFNTIGLVAPQHRLNVESTIFVFLRQIEKPP